MNPFISPGLVRLFFILQVFALFSGNIFTYKRRQKRETLKMLCGDRGRKTSSGGGGGGGEGEGTLFPHRQPLIFTPGRGKAVNGRVGQAELFLLIKFLREQI
jgi:hypothetical protein